MISIQQTHTALLVESGKTISFFTEMIMLATASNVASIDSTNEGISPY